MNSIQFYRALVVLNGIVPLLVLGWDAYQGQLGANAVNDALHVTGILSLVLLCLSLAMTPLRWATGWGGWIAFRRVLGLYGFLYAVVHVAIYVGLDRALSIASTLNEIWLRRFLQVGTAAVLLMIPLAATSTNAMIEKLGPKRWKMLHRLAYVVAALAVIHYYMAVKSDVRQPFAFAGVVTCLLGIRFGKHIFALRRGVGSKPSPSSSPARTRRSPTWKGELTIESIMQNNPTVNTSKILFRRSQVESEISVDTSVLEAAEESSIELPYECRSGSCGQCKTRLLAGQVSMECEDALSATEKANGWILACQAHPRSDLVIDA